MAFSSDRTSSPGVYRVVVRGRLTDRFAASFDGMVIEPGETTSALTGRLRDQSHLMGILRTLDALGIELVSELTGVWRRLLSEGLALEEGTPVHVQTTQVSPGAG